MRFVDRAISTRFLVLTLLVLPLSWATLAADEAPTTELPAVFSKAVPENPADLLAIQKHVQALVKKLQPATVGIRIGAAQGSGIIVTKDGYVLTAGHVSGKPGQTAQIILSDGRKLKAKSLGRNAMIDSGLMKIEEEGEYPFIEMGHSSELAKGDWCIAIGHPGGVKPGRPPVVRLGRVLDRTKMIVQTDCTLVGGDSGGPLFDMHGKVIGINSRIGPSITANIHVPVDTYRDTWERLAKGEEFGFRGPKLPPNPKVADVYMGVMLDFESNNAKVKTVVPNSPAARAGLMVDDVITQVDGKKITTQLEINNILLRKRANDEISVDVLRGEKTLTLKLKLEKRPVGS